jgi:hypothetical protein
MPTVLQELSEDELVQVLTQPRTALHVITWHLPVYCHILSCLCTAYCLAGAG